MSFSTSARSVLSVIGSHFLAFCARQFAGTIVIAAAVTGFVLGWVCG